MDQTHRRRVEALLRCRDVVPALRATYAAQERAALLIAASLDGTSIVAGFRIGESDLG